MFSLGRPLTSVSNRLNTRLLAFGDALLRTAPQGTCKVHFNVSGTAQAVRLSQTGRLTPNGTHFENVTSSKKSGPPYSS